ncbi:MAG: hypothetical protein BWX70_03339 [Verrucomicrobia bacterium ADurb.Bin070]|nr:MAG: hypothetical protein BWX70_03339 [Verrucomicrobia bacterium ADurb.Bin070]
MTGGRMAPPAIAEIIRPEISLARSGIASTAIEKINGKMFAKPSAATTIPA